MLRPWWSEGKRGPSRIMHLLQALCWGLVALFSYVPATASNRTFTLEDNRFVKDGQPIRLLSGRSGQSQPATAQF